MKIKLNIMAHLRRYNIIAKLKRCERCKRIFRKEESDLCDECLDLVESKRVLNQIRPKKTGWVRI